MRGIEKEREGQALGVIPAFVWVWSDERCSLGFDGYAALLRLGAEMYRKRAMSKTKTRRTRWTTMGLKAVEKLKLPSPEISWLKL